MPSFSDFSDIDLEKRIRQLSKELSVLKSAAEKRGSAAWDDASDTAADVYSAVSDAVSAALPRLRKSAKAVEKTAYDHPATVAAVGLVVLGLAASLLLRKR